MIKSSEIKTMYCKPQMEVIFMNMEKALLEISADGNAGGAEDDGELNAKEELIFDEDVL